MKGIVEIYGVDREGKESLLYKKPNMMVVGFSENIVDLLTTPSSIQYPTAANTSMLDASNYEIQGFSMSKSSTAFKNHQHSYKTINLLLDSDFTKDIDDESEGASPTSWWVEKQLVISENVINGPTPDSRGTLVDALYTSGADLRQRIYFDGINDGRFDAHYFSGTEFTFSIDVKINKDNPPVSVSGTSSYKGYSVISLLMNSVSAHTLIEWDSSGGATMVDNGYGINWNGGIKKISTDWYRVFLTGENSGDSTHVEVRVYPSLAKSPHAVPPNIPPINGPAGSIYVSRPQLELGRVPTEYKRNEFTPSTTEGQSAEKAYRRASTLAYSLLNATYPYGNRDQPSVPPNPGDSSRPQVVYPVVSGSGELSLSAAYDPSLLGTTLGKGYQAYIPKHNLEDSVNYLDTVLSRDSITPVEEALGIQFNQGNIPAANGLLGSDGLQLSSFTSEWAFTSNYDSYIGRHLAYLGAYPDNGGGVSQWISYVSAYNFEGLNNPILSGYITPGASVSSLDRYGFWALENNGAYRTEYVSGSNFYKYIEPEFNTTNSDISYMISLENTPENLSESVMGGEGDESPQRDSALLNIFGGVYSLGLWGLDLKQIRSNNINNNPPYSWEGDLDNFLVEPTRKYKLFNKINLSDNLVRCEGDDNIPGVLGFYKTINIRWGISFL